MKKNIYARYKSFEANKICSFVLFFKLILVLLFAHSSFAENIRIGTSIYSLSDKYVTYLVDAIHQYDDEHEDVEVLITDSRNDSARMISDIENFIDSGVNAIVVMPTDLEALKPVVKRANKANVPIIIVNQQPSDDMMQDINAFIGSKSIDSGIMQAQEVVKLIGDRPAKVAILLGPLGHEAQIMRTEGNKQIFSQYDNISIVAEHEGRWDRATALQISEDLLQNNDAINVIVANNDEMAIGALLAANKAGLNDDDLIIAGIDATPDALEYLGKGLDITIYQSAYGQGYDAIKLAHKAANEEPIEKFNWIPFETVNVDDKQIYIDKYTTN